MKNYKLYIIMFIVYLLVISSFANGLITTDLNNMDESFNQIDLEFSFNLPTIKTSDETGNAIQSITIQDLPKIHNTGEPILPVKPIKILLPYGRTLGDISIEIMKDPIIYEEINPELGTCLVPISQTLNEKNMMEIQKTNDEEDIVRFVTIQKSKGFSILFLNIHPIKYDEQLKQLTYYPQIKVNIGTINGEYSKVIRSNPSDVDSIVSMVENPSCIDTYPIVNTEQVSAGFSYIIITNEELANSGLEDNFQTLINSKIDKGYTASIFTVEDIISNPAYSINGTWGDNNPSNPFFQNSITKNYFIFDDSAARIRNFIRFAYTELGTEYVLLGGDGDVGVESQNIIPARGLFANESGLPLIYQEKMPEEEEDDLPSDVYYACLDGSFNADMDIHFGESPDRNDVEEQDEADLMAEVYVGRACVDSIEEVANFVSKTLYYENSHHPYISKILFVGEYLGFPGISAYGGNYKDVIKPLIPEMYNLVCLYDRDLPYEWNKYDMIELINNATPHIINHDGHSYYGYNLKMHNSDVDYLTNTNPFFLYSHGCMAGGFDNPSGYDCIAERLTVETPFGAFAAIMNSRYGLGSENNLDSPSLDLDESFFKALYQENIREIGRANHYSKEDNIWQINENGIRWVFYETNLFGDPEISIKSPNQEPVELSLTITKPADNGAVYFRGSSLFSLPFINYPIVLGKITVEASVESDPIGNVYSVEFLINNQSQHVDTKKPFSWNIDTPVKGFYTLSVIANGYYGESVREDMTVYLWIR